MSRAHPPPQPHGEILELFPDVFFVTGTMRMPGPLPVRFSRNMTVVREGARLVLVNSVRLTEEGLKQLDALGAFVRGGAKDNYRPRIEAARARG